PPLERINPDVSPGLSDIVARCLATDLKARYPSAAPLAVDLRRHLADRPLAGVPNRSLGERWRKWRQRRPHASVVALMLPAVLGAAACVGLATWSEWRDRRKQANDALVEGKDFLSRQEPTLARQSLRRGLVLLEGQPFLGPLRDQLNAEDQRAADAERAVE